MKKFDKYEKLGAYHWDAYADKNSEYHAHVNRVVEWLKGENTLDVGAGDGLICSKTGAIGIEENETAVFLAKKKGANVRLASAYAIPYKDGHFGAAFLGDVIEHLERPEKALFEIHRVLQDGGRLYVVWPAPGMVDPYAVKAYSTKELVSLVEGCGFAIADDVVVFKSRTYAKFIKQTDHANDTKGKAPRVGRGKKSV